MHAATARRLGDRTASRDERGPAGRGAFATAAFVAAVLVLLAVGCRAEDPRPDATLVGTSMGTSWKVTVVRDGGFDRAELARLRAVVQDQLDAVDASMSTWKADSEISRFNRADPGEGVVVSAPVWEVLDVAADVHGLTDGAFDPTVHPLVRAWGFGGGGRDGEIPDEDECAELATRVGLDLVRTQRRPLLDKARAGVELDFSAVAKGFAVDRVHDALVDAGVGRMLVEVGGEVRVRGERPGGGPWRVGVEDPRVASSRVPFAVVEMSEGALATSGDYRNTVATAGGTIAHLFDPRVGRPVDSRVASVSVLAPTCARADALATGLAVLGAEAARALAEREGTFEVLVLERGPTDGADVVETPELVETQSPGFARCRIERP